MLFQRFGHNILVAQGIVHLALCAGAGKELAFALRDAAAVVTGGIVSIWFIMVSNRDK